MARPGFRNSGNPENIKIHQEFNEWILENANKTEPEMILINNEFLSISETAKEVMEGIKKCLRSY